MAEIRKVVTCACCGDDCHENYALRIYCEICEPGLDICLDCFANSVVVGQHKPFHRYSYRMLHEEQAKFPLLPGNWNSQELFQLLEGLEQFGYGNWDDVSRYVDTKGPNECREAVNSHFVNGPIGSRTYDEIKRGNAVDHTTHKLCAPSDKKVPDIGDVTTNELLMVGWLPSRDEFEVEHCNDAETLVSCLDPGKTAEPEEEVELALKLTHVELYQAKLKERQRRREMAAEYGLIKHFLADQMAKNLSKPKKKDGKGEILEKLKMLAKFQSVSEYDKFVTSMSREKELKSRIKELHRYRKNGVTQHRDGDDFDTERLRRNKLKTEKKRAAEAGLDLPPSIVEHPQGGIDLDNVTNITTLPGYDLLSASEKRLCAMLRLHPNLYTSYKTCLIRDHIQKRRGQIIRAVHPSGLDKAHRKKIFNFLLQAGWISAY